MVMLPSPHPLHGDIPCPNDYGSRPGSPSWGPYLDRNKAIEHERKLTIVDPMGALAWDRKADARQAAWDDSIFANALDVLSDHGWPVGFS